MYMYTYTFPICPVHSVNEYHNNQCSAFTKTLWFIVHCLGSLRISLVYRPYTCIIMNPKCFYALIPNSAKPTGTIQTLSDIHYSTILLGDLCPAKIMRCIVTRHHNSVKHECICYSKGSSQISHLLLHSSLWLLVPGLSSQFCHCFLYTLDQHMSETAWEIATASCMLGGTPSLSLLTYPNDSLWCVRELWEYVEVKYDGDLGVDGAEGGPLLWTEGTRRLVQAVVKLFEAALKVRYDRPTQCTGTLYE